MRALTVEKHNTYLPFLSRKTETHQNARFRSGSVFRVLSQCINRLKAFFCKKNAPLAKKAPDVKITSSSQPVDSNGKRVTQLVLGTIRDPNAPKGQDEEQLIVLEIEIDSEGALGSAEESLVESLLQLGKEQKEEDDPTLKITHFPPSNRLH